MNEHSILEVRTTLEKLLGQLKEAEKLSQSKETHSERFKVSLKGIRQTATIGRERSRIVGDQTPYEGHFIGILDDLDDAERQGSNGVDLADLLKRNRKAIESTLSQE